MAARVIHRMTLAKASILVFVVVAILTTLFMIKLTQGQAAPGSPTDSAAVPHYFGPWPNWALSPLTLPDATVAITGDGAGAKATATVGGNGAVTGITITDPGSGYTYAGVSITGAGDGALATATVTPGGALNNVNVTHGGGAYKTPVVSFSGGGATTPATGTVFGGIDVVKVGNTGSGYQFPTVDIDMPDDPDGTQAKAHAVKDADGAITSIVVDEPGSGYSAAPRIVVRDGTAFDPVPNAGIGRRGHGHAHHPDGRAGHVRRGLHVRAGGRYQRLHRRRRGRDGDRRGRDRRRLVDRPHSRRLRLRDPRRHP